MSIYKYIPNILTLGRIVLSSYMHLILVWNHNSEWSRDSFLFASILTIIIFSTDFLDGRLARKLGCCTKHGAILDVVADFYYIFGQLIILTRLQLIPGCVLYCVVIEFMFFILSSCYLKEQYHSLIYDRIGRFTAAFYYVIPYVVILIMFTDQLEECLSLIVISCFILTLLAVGSRFKLITKNLHKTRI